jgi:hypothetical protein
VVVVESCEGSREFCFVVSPITMLSLVSFVLFSALSASRTRRSRAC